MSMCPLHVPMCPTVKHHERMFFFLTDTAVFVLHTENIGFVIRLGKKKKKRMKTRALHRSIGVYRVYRVSLDRPIEKTGKFRANILALTRFSITFDYPRLAYLTIKRRGGVSEVLKRKITHLQPHVLSSDEHPFATYALDVSGYGAVMHGISIR